MPTDLRKARELFLHAVGKLPADEWEGYVAEACGADADLAQQVGSLLQVHREAGSFLDEPAPGLEFPGTNTELYPSLSEGPGASIGPYKLLEQIGEGGMGVVFMAEQERPVKRRVALKIIKPGMDTRQVSARFEAERQALAMMDHPNIARVLDAGTTGTGGSGLGVGEENRALSGPNPQSPVPSSIPHSAFSIEPPASSLQSPASRPFFVMELVKGVPVTDYCDRERLTVRQRLELFTQVCHAVQHAHQKGIIHRDLKPSNVLVAEYDGQPVPKVIDFGVAKATAQPLTERTMFTQYGQLIGTFEYMSPEQARFNQLDVDTRSDIYSLGVLLYELLTGSTPLEKERVRSAAFDEVLRIIREEEPPKPSTRLSTSGSLPLAGRDQTSTGDPKSPERSAVVGREANGEGVSVKAASLASIAANRQSEPARLAKELRGELDWIAMTCLEKDRSRRYETANGLLRDIERYLNDEAVQACPPSAAYRLKKFIRRNKAAAAFVALLIAGITALAISNVQTKRSERRAITESAKAQAISDLLQGMLASANPDAAKGAEYTVRKLLDDFSAGLGRELAEQPEVEAEIHATIGRAYWRLGVSDVADAHINKALELRRSLFGSDHEIVAESLVDYAWNLAEQGRHAEAKTNIREALRIYRLRGASTEQLIHAQWSLQRFLISLRRLEEAEAVAEDTLALARKSGGEYPDVANILHALADAQNQQSRHQEAVRTARQAVELHRKVHGPKHPETAWGLRALAQPLINLKKYDEAEIALRQALEIFRQSYGSEHKSVNFTLADLRTVFLANGDNTKLEALARQQMGLLTARANKMKTEQQQASQRCMAEAHFNLGYALMLQSKHYEAITANREAIRQNPEYAPAMRNLAVCLARTGQLDDAITTLQKAIEIEPNNSLAYSNLGFDLYQQRKLDEAAAAFQKAIELKFPGAQPYVGLGKVLSEHKELDEAAAAYRQAIEVAPDAEAYTLLGDVLLEQGKHDEAMSNYRKAIEPALVKGADSAWEWFPIAVAYWKLGNATQAHEWYERGVDWLKKHHPDDPDLDQLRDKASKLLSTTHTKSVPTTTRPNKLPANTDDAVSSPLKTDN